MAGRNHEQPWDIKLGNGKGERDAVSALEERPEHAQKIGTFVGLYGAIETVVPHLLAEVTDLSDEEAERLTGHVQSVSSRIDLIEEVVLGRNLDQELKESLSTLISELRWLNSERNKYLHAQYASTGMPETVRRISYFTDTKKKKKVEKNTIELTVEDIQSDIERAKRLSLKLWDQLKVSRI